MWDLTQLHDKKPHYSIKWKYNSDFSNSQVHDSLGTDLDRDKNSLSLKADMNITFDYWKPMDKHL